MKAVILFFSVFFFFSPAAGRWSFKDVNIIFKKTFKKENASDVINVTQKWLYVCKYEKLKALKKYNVLF